MSNMRNAIRGLTAAEKIELLYALSSRMQEQTLEEQGHFRTVEPRVVLEIAFNNVMRSDRHASGFALLFPRILRSRTDKPADEIDTLARIE